MEALKDLHFDEMLSAFFGQFDAGNLQFDRRFFLSEQLGLFFIGHGIDLIFLALVNF